MGDVMYQVNSLSEKRWGFSVSRPQTPGYTQDLPRMTGFAMNFLTLKSFRCRSMNPGGASITSFYLIPSGNLASRDLSKSYILGLEFKTTSQGSETINKGLEYEEE